MILVDTSVWIDYLIDRDSSSAEAIESVITGREDICICGVILTEILQGISDNTQYNRTREIISELVFLPMTREIFCLAADIYRTCRSRGITIRNSIDCMIAAVCIHYDVFLLHNDKDFTLIASQFGLQIYQPEN